MSKHDPHIPWDNFDEQHIRKIQEQWAAESEDRIDAVDRGELPTVDGPSGLEDLRSYLRELDNASLHSLRLPN